MRSSAFPKAIGRARAFRNGRLGIGFTAMVLCLLFFALSPASAFPGSPAGDLPAVEVGADQVDAAGFPTVVVADRNRTLTIDQIAAGQGDVRIANGRVVAGFRESNYWLGFRLHNNSGVAVTRIISIDDWYHTNVDFYELTSTGWQETRSGLADKQRPLWTSPISHMQVQLAPGETRTVYVSLHSLIGLWSSGVQVQDPHTFDIANRRLAIGLSIFFGGIAALILYNISLLTMLRERIYFFYVAAATMTLLYTIDYIGFLPLITHINSRSALSLAAASAALFTAFSYLFIRRLLEIDKHFPALNKALMFIVYSLFVAAASVTVALDYSFALTKMMVLVGDPLLLVLGVLCWKRGIRYAREFVLIYGVFLAGLVVHAWENFGFLPFNYFTRYAFMFGSFFELTGLSVLLAYRIRSSQRLADKLAYRDALTELPNRRLFQDRLEQEIKKSGKGEAQTALMLIDLDHFKEINDNLGHDVGDGVLMEAADRIRGVIRNYDTAARLGGDEFAVILSEIQSFFDIQKIAQSIIDSLSKEYVVDGKTIFSSASAGIAVHPDDAADAKTLIRYADQAMYQAKKDGRRHLRFFTDAMQETSEKRLRLSTDLRSAIAERQLMVYYQPIVELSTGRIRKAEALSRWNHPDYGLIPPDSFIPIAEEDGLIPEISDWVFRQAVQEITRCQEITGSHFQVSINKSPAEFRGRNAGWDTWLETLEDAGLSGRNVVIEVTEGLMVHDDDAIAAKLSQFRDAGVQVAMDDFGTGYSSLGYLTKFSIDYLKIDKSFTRDLTPGSPNYALCEAITVMAHKLGLAVIAEGVETEHQRDLLQAMGCEYAQGYLFSRAVPGEVLEALLEDQSRVSGAT